MQNIKEYVASRKLAIKTEVETSDTAPKLVIVQVGNVEASNRYVRNKIADCAETGITCELVHFDNNISEEELFIEIERLNANPDVTGFIVQFPLPKHISEKKVMAAISPDKDLDGFHPMSKTVPATPLGIYTYLKDMHFDFAGKNAVVIGRSDIVGRPMAKLLLNESMNVTVLHSKTAEVDKELYIRNADLIVVATGHRGTLTKNYDFKPSAVVIDVGINVDEDGKLCGDCEKELPVAFQSPVPGGCGLLTRLALIENALDLLKK